MLRLNSLKYSISILEGLTKEKYQWNDKLKLIGNLRKNWFKANDFGLLASLNEDSIKIAMGITEKFREFVIKNGLIRIKSGNDVRYNGIKNKSLFVKEWSKDKVLHDMIKSFKSKKKSYSVLPVELSAQLVEYSKQDGKISSYIKNNLSGDLTYELRHKDIVKHRITILNKQAELAYRLKHSDFAAFFDFGYRNKSGINNWILNLLDKVRF